MRTAKPCKVCDREFFPFRTTEKVCSVPCALEYAKAKAKKKYDKETRRLKREHRAKDRSYQLKRAQNAFNAYIRFRDRDKPCISCGAAPGTYRISAGHYRSVGAAPELRFEPDNCFGQCWYNCNSNKSGNPIEMRKGMIERIGVERVEWLEGPHEPRKYSIDEIVEIRNYFQNLTEERNENI